QRQVAHQHLVAGARRHPLEQRDLALEAGDQRRRRRFVKAPLHDCAQAVGVAVADVETSPANRLAWIPTGARHAAIVPASTAGAKSGPSLRWINTDGGAAADKES